MTFGIGIFTTLPGVRMFCLYTCLQVTFTYIYQLTFFSPVLAYAAEMENSGMHSLFFRKALKPDETTSKWRLFLLAGSVCRKSQQASKPPLQAAPSGTSDMSKVCNDKKNSDLYERGGTLRKSDGLIQKMRRKDDYY
ncbi:hypothetical protein ANCDUO_04375 [Ancylostoma duodenale]|uniref:SSD domain-containing protein n=1 Tax=Ancylostoma duodenale TaxID=51022 RepID=A0A0C2D6R1_9BILA|nr:hypothetical protein ANCDUO_04375 [Ancylostoma duodenale]